VRIALGATFLNAISLARERFAARYFQALN